MKLVLLTTDQQLTENQAEALREKAQKRFGPDFNVVLLSHGVTCQIVEFPSDDEKAD